MVGEIKITNIKTKESFFMTGNTPPYVIDKISWDSPEVEMEKYRVPYQIGSSLSGVIVGTRKPSFIGYIVADMTKENVIGMGVSEYYSNQKKKIEQSKMILNRIVSIYDDVMIEAGSYKITGRPTMPVKYSDDMIENNEILCRFSMEVECMEPLFFKDEKTNMLSSVSKNFHFPLVIPEEDGMTFGVIMVNNIAYVINDGQAETGITIKIKAVNGSIIDPQIRKVYTNEFLKFENLTIKNGNTLTITTDIRKENAILHDVESGDDIIVVGYMDVESTFLRAGIGTTIFVYEAEDGTESNSEVTISITEKYFNFEEM